MTTHKHDLARSQFSVIHFYSEKLEPIVYYVAFFFFFINRALLIMKILKQLKDKQPSLKILLTLRIHEMKRPRHQLTYSELLK